MEATGKNNALPLTYKGRPLMRKDATIYYGSMADKYIIMLQVLSAEQKDGYSLANRVAIQLQYTDPEISSKDRVVKTAERDSLYDAMKRFLQLSREERQEMGVAGRAHMETVFDKNKVVSKTIENLY